MLKKGVDRRTAAPSEIGGMISRYCSLIGIAGSNCEASSRGITRSMRTAATALPTTNRTVRIDTQRFRTSRRSVPCPSHAALRAAPKRYHPKKIGALQPATAK
jgi:hypothetical protein